jgi:hypothetical protein
LPWKEEVWKGLVERREEEGVGDERWRRENLYQKPYKYPFACNYQTALVLRVINTTLILYPYLADIT